MASRFGPWCTRRDAIATTPRMCQQDANHLLPTTHHWPKAHVGGRVPTLSDTKVRLGPEPPKRMGGRRRESNCGKSTNVTHFHTDSSADVLLSSCRVDLQYIRDSGPMPGRQN